MSILDGDWKGNILKEGFKHNQLIVQCKKLITVSRELKILNPENEVSSYLAKCASVLLLVLHLCVCVHVCVHPCVHINAMECRNIQCFFKKSSIQPKLKNYTLIKHFANIEMTHLRSNHLRKSYSLLLE